MNAKELVYETISLTAVASFVAIVLIWCGLLIGAL